MSGYNPFLPPGYDKWTGERLPTSEEFYKGHNNPHLWRRKCDRCGVMALWVKTAHAGFIDPESGEVVVMRVCEECWQEADVPPEEIDTSNFEERRSRMGLQDKQQEDQLRIEIWSPGVKPMNLEYPDEAVNDDDRT